MRRLLPALPFLIAPILLGGMCDSDPKPDTSPESVNNAPIANAGTDISQPADQAVALDGHSSFDPDGDVLTYHWSFEHLPDGSQLESREAPFARNHDATAVSTAFTPDVIGTYVIELFVQDSHGANSAPDYVVVVAEEPESVPVADAGDDLVLVLGETANLDGGDSYDPQGRTLTYSWSLVDIPDDSTLSTASISGATSAAASFTPDVKGVFIANLQVDNGLVGSLPDAAVVTVTGDNGAPTANAGEDLETMDCTPTSLDASGSVDPDGDTLVYYWDLQGKPAGSDATVDSFSARDVVDPTFFADVAGEYVLSVAVFDGEEWSSPDLVTLTVAERSYNSAPSVDPGSNKEFEGGEVSCEPSGYDYACDDCDDISTLLGDDATITDADGDPLTYLWTVVDGSATIHDPTSLETAVVLSDCGIDDLGCALVEYIFELAVTDCTGETVTEQVTFTIECCGVKGTSHP
jgi:hypothetical protein